MKSNKLVTTALQAPYPLKRGFPLAPRMVFLASLSLYAASSPVGADDAVALPGIPPGLDVEFRCAGASCPLTIDASGESGTLPLGSSGKYLEFEGLDIFGGCYTPLLLTNGSDGIGADCFPADEDGLEEDEGLEIFVRQGAGGFDSSTAMEGIYLDGLENFNDDESCSSGSRGSLIVNFVGDGGEGDYFEWNADTEESGGSCTVASPHAIFVDFDGTLQVTSLELKVDEAAGSGVYAAGVEKPAPAVDPETCDGGGTNNEGCVIDLVPTPLPGGKIEAFIADPALEGSVSAVEDFPKRVRDDRDHCQKDEVHEAYDLSDADSNDTLVFDGSKVYNVDGVDEVLELIVSDNLPGAANDYFTISAKGCGTPRFNSGGPNYMGPAVARDSTDPWEPYIDIIAINTDIVPVASTVELLAEDEAAYACQEAALLDGTATLDQPFMEINARNDEIKYLAGVSSPTVDPTGRDISYLCGSKRGIGRAYSYVAYNLIHAPQIDMRDELGYELKEVLLNTLFRTRECISPIVWRDKLKPKYGYIRTNFKIGVSKASNKCNARRSKPFFRRAANKADAFITYLERPGVSGKFASCYATDGPLGRLSAITDTAGLGTQPLNAYGDIVAQVKHLSYAIRAFVDVLAEDDDCPD